MSHAQLGLQFLLELIVILATVRAVGFLGHRFLNQPQVVCEMVAGVLLGPSLLGRLWPETQELLFPKSSFSTLYIVSQVGLVLYMFVVGLEFRGDIIKNKGGAALAVSLSGIAAPFLVAGALAHYFVAGEGYFGPQVGFGLRWLFLGAAISITAFPVLARIIHEQKIGDTTMGAIALASGAANDLIAWCIFAIVLATFSQDPSIAVAAIGGGASFAIVSIFGFRKIFARLYQKMERRRLKTQRFQLTDGFFALVIIFLMMAACLTEAMGIHAVFGAFMAGVTIPKGKLTELLKEKIEPLTVNLFLPLFFVSSGLNTKFSLLLEPDALGIAGLILAGSMLSKFGACSISAFAGGEKIKSALCIGTLMNARGLMELILLNIGLSKGLITQNLFTALAMMAIVTTLMATPLFNFLNRMLPGEFRRTKKPDSSEFVRKRAA